MAHKGVGSGQGGRSGRGGDRRDTPRGPRQPVSMKKGGARAASFKGKETGGAGGRHVKNARPEAPKTNYKPAVSKRDTPARPKPPRESGHEPASGAGKQHSSYKRKEFRATTTGPGQYGEPFRKALPKPSFHEKKPDTGPRTLPEPGPAPHGLEDKVMGINPVLELLRSGSRPVDALYIDKDKGGKQFGEMVSLARQKGIPVKVVPRAALDGMSWALRHQGAVAVVSPKGYEDPYGLVDRALAKGHLPLLLILDGVEDPQNLGAIIRTAESAGVDGIIIPEHRAAHLSSAVARASAGALEHMPVAKASNIAGFAGYLKGKGFWIVGLAGESERDYTVFDMNAPLAVVLGGEGAGIRPIVKKSCDILVSLPMLGRVSSLNVSVAAGVMLYEIIRQRRIR